MKKLLVATCMVTVTALSGCTTMNSVFGRDKTGMHDLHHTTASNHAPVKAGAHGYLVDANKMMTLYVYDKDTMNKSNCDSLCLAAWPAFLAPGPVDPKGNTYSTIRRDDGRYQWAMNGKPLYFYANDTKVGDKDGDGKMGVWHAIPAR